MSDAQFRRYWIEFDQVVAGASRSFGVTAIDLDDALALIGRLSAGPLPPAVAVVQDVDVRTLDVGHVLPNMDPPNWRGVWFPMGIGSSFTPLREPTWASDPFSVHVAASRAIVERLATEARAAGARMIQVDLSDIHDRDGLDQLLARTFAYPFKTRGFDAAISMTSDLEWLGPTAGYLVIIDGIDEATQDVEAEMVGILPNIVNRWRTQGQPFVAVLVGRGRRDTALAILGKSNAFLTEAGKFPWINNTGAVTVIDHSSEK